MELHECTLGTANNFIKEFICHLGIGSVSGEVWNVDRHEAVPSVVQELYTQT